MVLGGYGSDRVLAVNGDDPMIGDTFRRKVTITDPQGFHMRPASLFAQKALEYGCSVRVSKESQWVNGKSPIELLLLFAPQGTELVLETSGNDAEIAIEALAELLSSAGLGEPLEPSVPRKG